MTTPRIDAALEALAAAIEADKADGLADDMFHSWAIFATDGFQTTAHISGGCCCIGCMNFISDAARLVVDRLEYQARQPSPAPAKFDA